MGVVLVAVTRRLQLVLSAGWHERGPLGELQDGTRDVPRGVLQSCPGMSCLQYRHLPVTSERFSFPPPLSLGMALLSLMICETQMMQFMS